MSGVRISALLHRLKLKLILGKANVQDQLEFLEDYERLKEDKHSEDLILFMDGVHLR